MVLKAHNHLYIKLAKCLTQYLLKSLALLKFFETGRYKTHLITGSRLKPNVVLSVIERLLFLDQCKTHKIKNLHKWHVYYNIIRGSANIIMCRCANMRMCR
jgi:hypothetical protein